MKKWLIQVEMTTLFQATVEAETLEEAQAIADSFDFDEFEHVSDRRWSDPQAMYEIEDEEETP